MSRMASLPLNEDAAGTVTAVEADAVAGPITVYPPLGPNGRGAKDRSVSIQLYGTIYDPIVGYGRLDPSDADGWFAFTGVTLSDGRTVAAIDRSGGATPQIFVLPFDFAEIKFVATGGDGTSSMKIVVGP